MAGLGVTRPMFEEITGAAVVTFRVQVGRTAQPESRPESQDHRVLASLQQGPLGNAEISSRLGQRAVSDQLNMVIRKLLSQGVH